MVGAKGKMERKLASPTQNQSSPAQYFHSHPGRATLGGDTFFPAKMYKLISRHHGAPQIHSSWHHTQLHMQGNTLTEAFSQGSPTHRCTCSLPLGVGEERTPPRTSHPGPTRLEGGTWAFLA